MYPAALISASDVADFAIRLTIPFILALGLFALWTGAWVRTLVADHREPKTFIPQLALFLILLPLPAYLLSKWAPGSGSWLSGVNLMTCVAIVSVMLTTALLVIAGQTPGVGWDDKTQTRVLAVLRTLARPVGLFSAFVVLGVCLLETDQASVIFDFSAPVTRDGARSDCQDEFLVLEFKQSAAPIIVYRRMARFGTEWLVQRVVRPTPKQLRDCAAHTSTEAPKKIASDAQDRSPGATAVTLADAVLAPAHGSERSGTETPSPISSIHPATAAPVTSPPVNSTADTVTLQWIYVPGGDVACLRAFLHSEESQPLTRQCTSEPTSTAIRATPNLTPSIAAYAHLHLGCDPVGAHALIMDFDLNVPRTLEQAERAVNQTHTEFFSYVPLVSLTQNGLKGVQASGSFPQEPAQRLLASAAQSSDTAVWILGFASVTGSQSWNDNLAERRARALRYALTLNTPAWQKSGPYAGRLKFRGLGANVLSGIDAAQENPREQVAVAFVCRPVPEGKS